MCDIWDVRYIEMRDDEMQCWYVDDDGVPMLHHSNTKYEDLPGELSELRASRWGTFEPYRCASCQQWFMYWEDVAEHVRPFDEAFDIRKLD